MHAVDTLFCTFIVVMLEFTHILQSYFTGIIHIFQGNFPAT